MAATDTALLSLNAGEICRLALARIDLAKLRIAAEKQLIPHVLGPCIVQLRGEDCAGAAEPLRRA